MFKRFLLTLLTLIPLTIFVGMSASAETDANPKIDLSKENYEKLVDEGILQDVSYDVWVEVNSIPFPEEGLEQINNLSSVSLKAGDILVSNSTSSAGLTGHAGIALNSNQILHIRGVGHKPEVVSKSKWIQDYGYDGTGKHTRVYRHSSSTVASGAAAMGSMLYKDKNYEYGVTTSLYSVNPTYCSKIAWHAYNFYDPSTVNVPFTNIVSPYDLPNLIKNVSQVGYI